jgi:hypothetical protein
MANPFVRKSGLLMRRIANIIALPLLTASALLQHLLHHDLAVGADESLAIQFHPRGLRWVSLCSPANQ